MELQSAAAKQIHSDTLGHIQNLQTNLAQDITPSISGLVEAEISKAFQQLRVELPALIGKQIDERLLAARTADEQQLQGD
ncbi:MAG: hypothetical protein M1821_004908 [Bathelium mastoideum]|nr:MAG: hypothetical protein M1821_004908 [Bathelium mastoideum]KAI9689046.1 MAG: hypothetical protein M1822_000783 [Bathelium mastoideum]